MKIRVFNIDYLFENDSKYQREYLTDFIESEEGMTYDEAYQKEIDYLNSIREVVIDCGDWLGGTQFFNRLSKTELEDLILQHIIDETGEYILDFDYETLAD